jgi:hypothetical protein
MKQSRYKKLGKLLDKFEKDKARFLLLQADGKAWVLLVHAHLPLVLQHSAPRVLLQSLLGVGRVCRRSSP